METTATKRTNYTKRETTITWTGQPDSVTEEGSTWAGQVEITVSHYKQTKQFVAYARYALTKSERGFNVTTPQDFGDTLFRDRDGVSVFCLCYCLETHSFPCFPQPLLLLRSA